MEWEPHDGDEETRGATPSTVLEDTVTGGKW